MIKKAQLILAVMLVVCSVMMTGCGDSKLVLTTGFKNNEAFRVGSERATITELMLYLTNIANQYEQVYGEVLWNMSADEDTTMLDNCKEVALAQLSQVKAMKLLANEHKVTLTEEEEVQANNAAAEYMATLSEEEKEALGISGIKVVEQIYGEKLLADKLYAYLIRDVNPEISDDEARIITVQHILLKTYTVDEHGNHQAMSAEEKNKIYEKATQIYRQAIEGESFDTLISKYSEDSKGTYSFGVGDLDESFERAAFALSTGEIAPVTESSHGYHIIKCISTLDREGTELNKVKLLISRKQAVFGDTYNQFVEQLEKRENLELINAMELPDNTVVDTAELFSIYAAKLGSMFETEEK